jgi:uncharacterized membrane protein YeiH
MENTAIAIRHALEMIGVVVFAMSGVLSAGRKGMDLFGVAVIAMVTALGGGTLRDVLLDRRPIFWIADATPLWLSLAATILTLLYVRFGRPPYNALLVADAIGLALFTIGGTQIAEQAGQDGIVAVLMGTITGVAGGVFRDVLSAEVPLLLRPGRLYATAAIVGAALYLGLEHAGVVRPVAALAGMAVIAALRLAAILWGIRLPVPVLPDDDGQPPTT